MEVKGVLVQVLETVKGESAKGSWEKTDFVIETEGSYPKKICFTDFNNKANVKRFAEGQVITVKFNLESKEYQGRWFPNVTAWSIEGDAQPAQTAAPAATEAPF